MFCALQYRGLAQVVYRDKGEALYTSHAAALDVVRRLAPPRLLDLGCGPGFVAERCERLGVRVTGVDARDPLPGRMTEFRRAHLDLDPLPLDVFEFPVVLFLDVIEHLSAPEDFLLRIRNESRALVPGRPAPTLVVTTPNVAFAAVRLALLLGRFNYAERGILDIDHRRLFTRSTLLRTLRDCGYDVRRVRPVAAPFEVVVGGAAGRVLGVLAHGLARVWPTMFAFQFLVEVAPRPGLRAILDEATSRDGGP
jgi:2-polyprenyl-3-methyl-5-hydroxy-6-metoxy-1,4-benzoquinol methylase